MSIVIDVGLLLQILGVLVVLISQLDFWWKARKYGGLEMSFFWLLSVVRSNGEEMLPKEEIKKVFPEWWELAEYLSNDIRYTVFGLGLTLVGLFFELFNLTLTVY